MANRALSIKKITSQSEIIGASQVIKRGWQQTYRNIFPATKLAQLDEHLWQKSLRRPGRHNLVMVDGHQVVGVVSYGAPRQPASFQANTGELMSLYVLPESQGRGVGTALLNQAERGLRSLGFTSFALWVAEQNCLAKAFYQRHGWEAADLVREVTIMDQPVELCQMVKQG